MTIRFGTLLFTIVKVMVIKHLIAIVFILCFTSCHRYHSDVERSLTAAGSNRHELETVLEHYRDDPNPDKYRAACFLIRTLEGRKNLDTLSVAANQPIFDAIANYRMKHGKHPLSMNALYDRVLKALPYYQRPKSMYNPVLKTVTANVLINRIESVFGAKRQATWGDSISFDYFCRYILPFSRNSNYGNDFHDYWYKEYKHTIDSLKTITEAGEYVERNIQNSCATGSNTFLQEHSNMEPIAFRNLVSARVGRCVDMCGIAIDALRSLYIPATLNIIPWWGNGNTEHFIVKIPTPDTLALYDNTQRPFHLPSDELFTGMFWRKDVTDYSRYGLPDQVTIQMCRTIPKLYMISSTLNPNSLVFRADEDIPNFFREGHLEDVSGSYLKCSDVRLDVLNASKKHYIYLCCYRQEDFEIMPVVWAKIKRNEAKFENVAVNVLYFPAFYISGRMEACHTPFILQANGGCKQLQANLAKRETVVLYSKIPYRLNPLKWAQDMLGARFQLANRRDLHDSTTIYRVDHLPYYTQEVKLVNPQTARYAVYNFYGLSRPMIAEMAFYGPDASGREVKLQGKPFGNPGIYDNPLANICDSNRLTFARADPTNLNGPSFFGIDFGKPCKITRFRYLPRNDDNAVVPGELYELFYWNDGWQSLGKQEGRDDRTLVYTNVPENALLLLHNHTRGKENRPFTYENGKQIFW